MQLHFWKLILEILLTRFEYAEFSSHKENCYQKMNSVYEELEEHFGQTQ